MPLEFGSSHTSFLALLSCIKHTIHLTPSVVGRIGVGAHECVVDGFLTLEDLAVHPALIVVPDASSRPREHRSDRKQKSQLLGLEDAALRIDEWNALAVELDQER